MSIIKQYAAPNGFIFCCCENLRLHAECKIDHFSNIMHCLLLLCLFCLGFRGGLKKCAKSCKTNPPPPTLDLLLVNRGLLRCGVKHFAFFVPLKTSRWYIDAHSIIQTLRELNTGCSISECVF